MFLDNVFPVGVIKKLSPVHFPRRTLSAPLNSSVMQPGEIMARVSHETFALLRFRELAESRGYKVLNGQSADNRIAINGGVYYQFGDLRIELPDRTIIVEVESSGGVTNLAKYWECYESGRLTKPMCLLHIFRQKSRNDYESHMVVWRFLCTKMHSALGNSFVGEWVTYQDGSQHSLEPAFTIFSRWLLAQAA
jgi:hypothetical protein